MAMLRTSRFRDSLKSSKNRETLPIWDCNSDRGDAKPCVQPRNEKVTRKLKKVSRTSILAVPKVNRTCTFENRDPAKVKSSALLYEITERTKRLAMPKSIVVNGNAGGSTSKASRPLQPTAHRSKLIGSPRISELARPKISHELPSKPAGYVAPRALGAIATKRTLELAEPRKLRLLKKSRKPRLPKFHLAIFSPCSSRITYLARPKHTVDLREAQKNYLRRRTPIRNEQPPWQTPDRRTWKRLGYSTNVSKKSKRKRKRRRFLPDAKVTRSERSVISFGWNRHLKSRRRDRRKTSYSRQIRMKKDKYFEVMSSKSGKKSYRR